MRLVGFLKELWPDLQPRIWHTAIGGMLIAVLALPVAEAWEARSFIEPYKLDRSVDQAIEWLAGQSVVVDGQENRVYSVGLWNWDAFLIPEQAGLPLIDGWHDEGAKNVRDIRELRIMGWTGNVDIFRAHELLTNQGAQYVLVNRTLGYRAEASDVFWQELEAHPEMFEKQQEWTDVAIFRVLPLDSSVTRMPLASSPSRPFIE